MASLQLAALHSVQDLKCLHKGICQSDSSQRYNLRWHIRRRLAPTESGSSEFYQTESDRLDHGHDAIAGVELLEDLLQMKIDGVFAHTQDDPDVP